MMMITSLQCYLLSCLPLMHYCMTVLVFESPSSDYSQKTCLFACKANRIVTGLAYLASQHFVPERSVQAKPFFYCMVVLAQGWWKKFQIGQANPSM